MRQIFPTPRDLVGFDVYEEPDRSPPRGSRPYVILGMVASVDGGTRVDGVSGSLGSPADHRVFLRLRSLADVIVVGAQTVRAEGYGRRASTTTW